MYFYLFPDIVAHFMGRRLQHCNLEILHIDLQFMTRLLLCFDPSSLFNGLLFLDAILYYTNKQHLVEVEIDQDNTLNSILSSETGQSSSKWKNALD